MKEIKIEKLYQLNYTTVVLNSLRQKWSNGETYNFIDNKKRQHLLLCMLNCSATFSLKDGTKIFVPQNSLVYIPEESEYVIRFSGCVEEESFNSITVNFKLYDGSGTPFCLSNTIKVYPSKNFSHIIQTFHEIADNYEQAIISPMRISGLLYILLSDIGSYYHKKKTMQKFNIISKGINVLENKGINDIKIDDLAKMCNISPVYFRKLFKEYSGTTPIDYKLNAMIKQAKQYLLFGNKSISETADILGFSSTTYFCRIFKKKTGLTPMQYIKSELEK